MLELSQHASDIYFGVAKDLVDDNIDKIKKYIKWTDLAKERGDTIDKEIAIVKGIDPGPGLNFIMNQYKISSAYGTHLLTITPGQIIFGKFDLPNRSTESVASKLVGTFSLDYAKKQLAHKDIQGSITLNEKEAKRVLDKLIAFKEGKIAKTNDSDYQ